MRPLDCESLNRLRAEQVKEYVGPVMEHADAVCYSMEELATLIRGLVQ
jgi:hypothetical protein